MLEPNPADDAALIKKRLESRDTYHGADGCVRRDRPGMKRLIRWMQRNSKRNAIYGTIRCDGGVHGTGRALDWMLDARKQGQRRKAKRVINTWLAKDRRGRPEALARRMGIQMIIYNKRIWISYRHGWSPYGCGGVTDCHIDHIHIEMNKKAARRRAKSTSFWKYQRTLSGEDAGGKKPGDGGGGVTPSGRSAAGPHPPLHPPEPSPAG